MRWFNGIGRSWARRLRPVRGRNLDFVYFGSVDWGYTWQRPQQLAARLARSGRLLYVNPLGLRPPRWRDLGRIAGRLAPGRSGSIHNMTIRSITVKTLWLYVPFPHHPAATRVNAGRLARIVARWRGRREGRPPIVWAGTPSAAVLNAVEAMPGATLVYDCLDDFAAFHPTASDVAATEARLAARAKVVFATAEDLYERMRRINPATVRLPNGADCDHFGRALDPRLPAPPDMAGIPRPVLGYMGEIAGWFDLDLVETVATRYPNWHVVLIGPVPAPAAFRLVRRPNVHHLGRKPYEDLPAYVRQFDVCLLPFKVNALTAAVNPVKLYEYLAAGKPVVSTPLREVLRYRDVVTVVERDGFSGAIEAALGSASDPAGVAHRLAVARENTWDRRVADVLRVLGISEAEPTLAPPVLDEAEVQGPSGLEAGSRRGRVG